jgi:hypothetical protein
VATIIESQNGRLHRSAGKLQLSFRQRHDPGATFRAETARREDAMKAKNLVTLVMAVLLGSGAAVAQTEWVDHPDNPVVGIDDVGPWAPLGVPISAVVFDGATYHMWFTGDDEGIIWGDGIGHATSPDGVEWTMDPANPVLTTGPDGEWDDQSVTGGAVIHDGATFHMWYAGSNGDGQNIGYVTSPDGSVWTKHQGNPVMEHGPPGSWDDTWLGMDSVIQDGDGFKAWFMGSQGWDGVTSIGYATSPDGIEWTRHPDNPVLEPDTSPGSWEADLFNPTVAFDGTTYHMWYIGDYPAAAQQIGYAHSGDGIHWTKHPDNPVHEISNEDIFTMSVLAGDSGWRMWFSHVDYDVGWRTTYATSECCAPNWRQFIAAAAVASGAEGSFYQTDVDVNNADSVPVEFQFHWLPRGEDNSEPVTSETFTLEAGKSVRYANVLTEVFGLEPDSLGALLITASSPDLLAMSRTYNLGVEDAGGTYGQAMPAFTLSDFISHGETRRILFGTENADMRTNVGCQNATDTTTVVYLDLVSGEGTSLGRKTMMLRPLGNDQINRIFDGHNPVNGYVDVSSAQQGNLVYCYGSVLDNTTSDPTTIPPL